MAGKRSRRRPVQKALGHGPIGPCPRYFSVLVFSAPRRIRFRGDYLYFWSEAACAANELVVDASRLTPSLASSAETVPVEMPLFAAAARA
jgi:hypothetical protein